MNRGRMMREGRSFYVLDALRGLAALFIVFWHANGWFMAPTEGLVSYLAVDLFFIMSGFVIAHSYADKLARRSLTPLSFLRIRLIRLYPLYFLGAVLGCGWAITLKIGAPSFPYGFSDVLTFLPAHLLLIPTSHALQGTLYPLNQPAWSLALEAAINVAYACSWRHWSARNLAVVLCINIGLLAISATGAPHILSGGWRTTDWPIGVLRVAFGFPAGVFLYALWRRGVFRVNVGWLPPLLATAAILSLVASRSSNAVALVCITVLFPAIVLASASATTPAMLRPTFVKLGAISYPIYILHGPILATLGPVVHHLGLDLNAHRPWTGIAAIGVVLVLGLIADAAFDRPVRRFLTKRFQPPPAPTPLWATRMAPPRPPGINVAMRERSPLI